MSAFGSWPNTSSSSKEFTVSHLLPSTRSIAAMILLLPELFGPDQRTDLGHLDVDAFQRSEIINFNARDFHACLSP